MQFGIRKRSGRAVHFALSDFDDHGFLHVPAPPALEERRRGDSRLRKTTARSEVTPLVSLNRKPNCGFKQSSEVGALDDNVRYPRQFGEYRLTESFTARDPIQTFYCGLSTGWHATRSQTAPRRHDPFGTRACISS